MILSRIVATASALMKEFERTNIIPLLQKAINLAGSRGNLNAHQYQTQVQEVLSEAKAIVQSDRLKLLPDSQQRLLSRGGHWHLVPARLAEILLSGVQFDKEKSLSSTELAAYLSRANAQISEASFMVQVGAQLDDTEIVVPDGHVSFDVTIPREIYGDNALHIALAQSSFIDVMEIMSELATGTQSAPRLVYSSTTDLVAGFAVIADAAPLFLKYYKELLELALVSVNLLTLIKSLRATPIKIDAKDIDDQIVQQQREGIERVAQHVVESDAVSPNVDQGRRNELKTKLTMKTKVSFRAVLNGASVDVTQESQVSLEKLERDGPISSTEIKELSAQAKTMQATVKEAVSVLKEALPLRLEEEGRSSD